MKTRNLGGGLGSVSAIGLGCMGMSEFYGPTNRDQSYETLDRALELGVTFYDTADTYGIGANETLLSDFVRQNRDNVTLATKFAIIRSDDPAVRHIDSSPAYMKQAVEASLKRLGIDQIDLYYAHRLDGVTPIEDTVGAMADLVREGKVRTLGLSEASAATIRRAHAVHPIAAVQSEYSLWTRDPEAEVLPTCRELGIGFVPFSPLGRGFLAGAIKSADQLGEKDFRRGLPRFEADNLARNLAAVERLEAFAATKGVTAAQLALAWVLHQGDFIVPIPGSRKIANLEQNVDATAIELSDAELAEIGEIVSPDQIAGARYPEAMAKQAGR